MNYQVAIWKRAHVPDPHIPVPSDDHGWTMIEGKLEPLWYEGDMIPIELADISEGPAFETDDDGDSDGDISLPDDSNYMDTFGDSDSDEGL